MNSAAQIQCGNCVSTQAPCQQPACVTYQCVRGATSQCSVTCGNGQTTTTRTCMAYSGGQQYPVGGMNMTAAATQQCGNCVSTSAPCVMPACVTYQCVTGATTTTRTCMPYSGGGQTPVNNYLGNPAAAQQCGNCQSTSAPCILCPNYVAQPPPYIAPPPYVPPPPTCVGGIQQISGAQALAAKLVVG